MFNQLHVCVLYLEVYSVGSIEIKFKKKMAKNFTNVNLFIELCDRETELINPFMFYFNSENYFQKLIILKSDLDKLIKDHHLTVLPQRKRRKRKLIRKCIR